MLINHLTAQQSAVEQKQPEYWVSPLPPRKETDHIKTSLELSGSLELRKLVERLVINDTQTAATTVVMGEMTLKNVVHSHSVIDTQTAATTVVMGEMTLKNVVHSHSVIDTQTAATTVVMGEMTLKNVVIAANEFDGTETSLTLNELQLQSIN